MLGIVVFAHGSRDPQWREPIEAVAREIARRDAATRVACAYLELNEPSLPAAAQALVQAGVTELRVLPLFFGMGRHAREDLPLLLDGLRRSHPGVRFTQLPTAGENPRLIALLAEQALQELA